MLKEFNKSIVRKYESELRPPLDAFRRPRAGVFGLGATSLLATLVLFWFQLSLPFNPLHHERDGWFICSIFGLAGISACLYALISEFRHIHRVSISESGLTVTWSHVPAFRSERVTHDDRFYWSEFDAIAWFEAESLIALNQTLSFQFRNPNRLEMPFLEIPLGAERDIQLGNLLTPMLPPTASLPLWVMQLRGGT